MKKYAVYDSSTGSYCYRYADTLEDLEGTGFEDIITEEQLPVVFDGRGGYYHFRPDEYGFNRIIESDKETPLELEEMYTLNDPEFKLGWISPEGDTYSCGYTNHNKCAKMIVQKFYPDSKFPEKTLDRNGWLQVIDSWDGTQRQHGQFVFTEQGKITQKQADRLFDLGLYNNEEVKKLIADSENDW
ncbi:hypothetical protein SAMN02910265_01101 [Ruminococcus flavefaciens]|uniref:Uncharacterized protein n=1 Tax=Ruminococcus flavefaciens TaxID=1265 RepID=A0A1H6IPE7_RUMFL|nr:hypothetical protein [Ruminococcus flavefaciens]SEH51011.1 hypothetical protein SAMN02910265_01101 [Ruminococcus flavefaciens]